MQPEQPAEATVVASQWVETATLCKFFRALVITSLLSYVVFYFEPMLFSGRLNEFEVEVLNQAGYNALLEFPPTFFKLLFLLWIAAAIGMYTFSSPARVLYSTLVLFSTVTSLTSGLEASTPLTSFLICVSTLCDASLLTLAYLSPLRAKFV